MKEYIAETGGRYTYSDDILNLQELALSLSAIFEECQDFIISGCVADGARVSPGYVWLGGKVRRFEGAADAVYPYYIYETNRHESVVYANDMNKRGRTCYLCAGGTAIPDTMDPVTGKLPAFIEILEDYAPRFVDRFFGRYAVLLNSPFARQTIKKDLVLVGHVTAEKEFRSKTAVSVAGDNGYMLKGIVKPDGESSLGAYLSGLLVGEIVIHTDGTFSLMKQGKELARVTEEGISYGASISDTARVGSLRIQGADIFNTSDVNDTGCVRINYYGLNSGTAKYRDLAVYDGKAYGSPILRVIGKNATTEVTGLLTVRNAGRGIDLWNTAYTNENPKLTSLLSWRDSEGVAIATAGYAFADNYHFAVRNTIGDIILQPLGAVEVAGTLKINGRSVAETFVALTTYAEDMEKKVDKIAGKQLSTEDFTSGFRKKLEAITTGTIGDGSTGYVTSYAIAEALNMKLSVHENLLDVMDKSAARQNLDVYSKSDAGDMFLKISEGLQELVRLSAEEINSLPAEEATALRAEKQAKVRDTLDAEQRGTGDLKLSKSSNLSDVQDKGKARKNLGVYSTTEIDNMLAGKLGTDSAYEGVVFTAEMLDKLSGIKTGSFAYTDEDGKSHTQVEGYLHTSQVVKQLKLKADRLMTGYSSSEQASIAANLDIYTRIVADSRFARVETLFQDYITYLVSQGKTTSQASQLLREKLNVLSKDEIVCDYMRKDAKLTDLVLGSSEAQRQVCRTLGAAFALDYQPILTDTGWMQMSNSGAGTDTRRLFVRQIGNIVSVQGIINTARRDGGNWGGIVAVLPNKIQPPKYSVRTTACHWNDDQRKNKGSSFTIEGGLRQVKLYERGFYNIDIEINFTYFV
ncbi:hypothetical protein [uncultured Duncaniella sp.]|uniref:hypothetical protein n=1 Tax=uncultured Duncaniella sp. TaxID=2768039 RepID=UPI0025A97A8D|nr:hypothetical protein [uncultured Duncaniella sp.]